MLPIANGIQMLCLPAYTCCAAKAQMILNYFLPIRYSASRVARAQRAAKQQRYALLLSNAAERLDYSHTPRRPEKAKKGAPGAKLPKAVMQCLSLRTG